MMRSVELWIPVDFAALQFLSFDLDFFFHHFSVLQDSKQNQHTFAEGK